MEILDVQGLENVSFGDEIRQKEFCLRKNSVFLNNGALGSVPRRIMELHKKYLDEMASHPEQWFNHKVYGYWTEARKAVADFVGANVDDLFFVTNATQGLNTVIRCLKLQQGDAILATSLTYLPLKNLWADVEEGIVLPGVKPLFMEIKFPILDENHLVQQFDDYLRKNPNVKFVLVDHITSPSSVVIPIEQIIPVCHKYGAKVIVDGAHAPGQLTLNLNALGADFYIGNFHKWLYTPLGCAFLWIHPSHQAWIHPLQTSRHKGKSLDEQFFHQGSRNHISFVCAKHSLEFYKAIGGKDKIVGYISQLITQSSKLLVKELGLQPLAIHPSMEAPNLRFLKLPRVPPAYANIDIKDVTRCLQADIYEKYDIQTVYARIDDAIYLRLSLQIHNTIEDIHKLIHALREII